MKTEKDFNTREEWLEYQLTKALRVETNLSMMDSRSALQECDWDYIQTLSLVNSPGYKRMSFRDKFSK